MKIEGHTHTEYCPHGSGSHAEEMIIRAIELGYTDYSITEHAPLPQDFIESPIKDKVPIVECAMSIKDIEHYLRRMHDLKRRYADKIRLYVGFEIDYLEGYENFTTDFLNEYGKYIDDSILSVHFMLGRGGYRAIDYAPGDHEWGILAHYGDYETAEQEYYKVLEKSILADLGEYKPKRIGHPTLFRKFMKYEFEEKYKPKHPVEMPEKILTLLRDNRMGIEYNGSGLLKEYLGQTYPPIEVIRKAQKLGLIIVTGSDAHSVNEIGNTPEMVKEY